MKQAEHRPWWATKVGEKAPPAVQGAKPRALKKGSEAQVLMGQPEDEGQDKAQAVSNMDPRGVPI
jgi:hypothetical protein